MRRARAFLFSLFASIACSNSNGHAPRAARPDTPRPRKAEAPPARGPELDAVRIVAGLRGSETELDACFDGVEWSPGFVRLGWRVDTSGVVSDVEVLDSTLAEKSVAECLELEVAKLRFLPPERASSARWTFVRGLSREGAPPETEHDEPGDRKHKKKKKKKGRQPGDDRGIAIAKSSPGWIEPAKIEDVVHAGFGLIARCYRDGLDRDPELGGAVRLTFVIDEKGAVARVVDGGSDLPDARVIDCVAEGLYALNFPRPKRGRVHVLYRVVFDSG